MQEIDFSQFKSTVVLIDGIDKDAEGSKIGTGKSSIFAALTFVLYGETVSNMKANEIVNYIKGKEALVELEIDIESKQYKIERGRKPNILNIYRLDNEWINISRSDINDNELMIKNLLKMNFETFLQTTLFSVASEYNKPFLNMTVGNQKKVLENIFNFDGVNQMVSNIKDKIRDEQVKLAEIETTVKEVTNANNRIKNQITRLIESSEKFEEQRHKKIKDLKKSIKFYTAIDIDTEKEKLSFIEEINSHKTVLLNDMNALKIDQNEIKTEIDKINRELEILDEKLNRENEKNESLKSNRCPTCHQEWFDNHAIEISDKKTKKKYIYFTIYNNVSYKKISEK